MVSVRLFFALIHLMYRFSLLQFATLLQWIIRAGYLMGTTTTAIFNIEYNYGRL